MGQPLSVQFFVLYFIHYFWLSADLPTSEISSKHDKSAEETKDEAAKETVKEEKVWPEPQKRVCPPVRAALILPDNVTCPGGCQRFSSTEVLDPATVSKLRYKVLTHHGYSFRIQHIVYWFNNPNQLLFLSSKHLYFFLQGGNSPKMERITVLSPPSAVSSPS